MHVRRTHRSTSLLQNHMRFMAIPSRATSPNSGYHPRSNPRGRPLINTVTMTHEENLSCDQCAHQFESTLELAVHMGVNPTNGTRFAPATPAIPISDSFNLDRESTHLLPSAASKMAETYVQSATSNLDDLNAEAIRCMSDARTAVPLLQNHMRFVHTEQGNFTELLEHLRLNPRGRPHHQHRHHDPRGKPSWTSAPTSSDSTLELAVHMGVNPTNGSASLPPPAIPISDSFNLDGSPHRLRSGHRKPGTITVATKGANTHATSGEILAMAARFQNGDYGDIPDEHDRATATATSTSDT